MRDKANTMQTENIPRGTLQITLTNGLQYLVIGLFYIAVTKSGALSPAEVGALSLLSFLSSTVFLFTGLTLPTALTKFVSEKLGKSQWEEAAAIKRTVTRLVLGLSVAGLVIGGVLSKWLSNFLLNSSSYLPLVLLTLIHAFLLTMIDLYKSTLQALYLFGKLALVSLLVIIISRGSAVTFAILNLGLKGVLLGYIAGGFAALIVALIFVHGRLPTPSHSAPIKPLLKFSIPLLISGLTMLVLNWADILIINMATHDHSLVGVYHITVNSVTALSILWIPVTTTILPALSSKHGLKKPEDITSILKTSSRYLFYLTIPSCLGLAAISPTALEFFYGVEYTIGAPPMSILCVAILNTAFYSILTTGLTAVGKTTDILKINIVLALSTLALLPILVSFFQILGAAFSRLITQVISVALAYFLLKKEVDVQIDKEAVWKSTLASLGFLPLVLTLEATVAPYLTTTKTLAIELL
ncbi:MAG: oligosaccharide flippase family protein, partial [Thermoproteota archaeon]